MELNQMVADEYGQSIPDAGKGLIKSGNNV